MNAHSATAGDTSASTRNLIVWSLIVLAVLIAAAIVLALGGVGPAESDPSAVALANERIKPVGEVQIAGAETPAGQQQGGGAGAPAGGMPAAAAAEAAPVDGAAVYQQVCFACHGTGVAGAPKFGNADDWAPRIAQGIDVLHQHALQGIRAMPPKGGFPNLSDDQVKAAVDYMVSQAKK